LCVLTATSKDLATPLSPSTAGVVTLVSVVAPIQTSPPTPAPIPTMLVSHAHTAAVSQGEKPGIGRETLHWERNMALYTDVV